MVAHASGKKLVQQYNIGLRSLQGPAMVRHADRHVFSRDQIPVTLKLHKGISTFEVASRAPCNYATLCLCLWFNAKQNKTKLPSGSNGFHSSVEREISPDDQMSPFHACKNSVTFLPPINHSEHLVINYLQTKNCHLVN